MNMKYEPLRPILRALLDHPETAGNAQDALDDIEMFVHRDPESPRAERGGET